MISFTVSFLEDFMGVWKRTQHAVLGLFALASAAAFAGCSLQLPAGTGDDIDSPVYAQAGSCNPTTYTAGVVNIQLVINNQTGQPLTLNSYGLSGELDHWNQRPQTTLPAGSCEIITGYSHDEFSTLSMYVEYATGSGDTAMFAAQADNNSDKNTTTGTNVVQRDGTPATDLAIDSSITPHPLGGYDFATVTATIKPAS
ncbi:hypothetical protein [Leifsonia shinshuensis]|uniref:hypothetical protein n=1 Tax=Leifsonia shinshuensis TaxID=150026 RepID=UPI002859700D|nr:hypothetical protein [Leifsonia shinshuensis]MDR6972678.1 hypothetical protein [Leifsonia shinshuensis]